MKHITATTADSFQRALQRRANLSSPNPPSQNITASIVAIFPMINGAVATPILFSVLLDFYDSVSVFVLVEIHTASIDFDV